MWRLYTSINNSLNYNQYLKESLRWVVVCQALLSLKHPFYLMLITKIISTLHLMDLSRRIGLLSTHTITLNTELKPVCRFVSDQYFVRASLRVCLPWLVLPTCRVSALCLNMCDSVIMAGRRTNRHCNICSLTPCGFS